MSTRLVIPTISIFVSSTFIDLQEERQAAIKAVQRAKATQYVGMEYFATDEETPRAVSLRKVAESQVYIGIFGGRYGSGITEEEYRVACEHGLPCFIFFKAEHTIREHELEADTKLAAKLHALKEKLRKFHVVAEFNNPDHLWALISDALHNWFVKYLMQKFEEELHRSALSAEMRSMVQGVQGTQAWAAIEDKYVPWLRKEGVPVASSRYQLQKPTRGFVGHRDAREELVKTLNNQRSVCIRGIHGAGKSELALFVAHSVRDSFPDGQLFIWAEDEDRQPRAATSLLQEALRPFIGPEEKLPDSINELRERYENILRDRRVLLLLENAAGGAQVEPLLPPAGSKSALLVTSTADIALPGMHPPIPINRLNEAEARKLLLDICRRIPPNVADRICELCGYMPMAIDIAGCTLKVMQQLSAAEYAARLEEERERTEVFGFGPEANMEAVVKLSYELLPPETALALSQLSVFPLHFNRDAARKVCDNLHASDLNDLVERGLIREEGSPKRYILRLPVRTFVEHQLTRQQRDHIARRHALHFKDVLEQAETLYLKGGAAFKEGIDLFDLEWRNIRAGQAWAAAQAERDDEDAEAADLCIRYPLAGEQLLEMRQPLRDRINWLQTALANAERLKRTAEVCRLLDIMAHAYNDACKYEASFDCCEKELAIATEAGDSFGIARALDSRGEFRTTKGQMEEAIADHRQAVEIFAQLGKGREQARALNNLGKAYHRIGRFGEAVEFFKQQCEISRRVGDTRAENRAQHNLGQVYADLGEFREALDTYIRQLAKAREIGSRMDEAAILNSCGNAYYVLGMTHKAVELYQQSLAINREIGYRLGENMARNNLGEAYTDLGDAQTAIRLHQTALEAFGEIKFPRGEVNALHQLGKAYYTLEQFQEAIKCYNAGLDIVRDAHHSLHSQAHLLNERGEARAKMCEREPSNTSALAEAFEDHRRALEIFRSIGDQLGEVQALNNLGKDHFFRNEFEEASKLFEQAIAIARCIFDRRGEAIALFNRGLSLDKLGDHAHAITHVEASLEIFEQIEHRHALEARRKLVQWSERK